MQKWILGLSTFMYIRGWPKGPPPPSQDTTLVLVQRTGCLWIRSMAARGWGCGGGVFVSLIVFHMK